MVCHCTHPKFSLQPGYKTEELHRRPAITDWVVLGGTLVLTSTDPKAAMNMCHSISLKALKLTFVGFAAVAGVAAMRLYYVQEMLAALILFAILFGCFAVVLLLLYTLDRAGQAVLEFLELRGKEVLKHARVWRAPV
jgi:hypothetical protein